MNQVHRSPESASTSVTFGKKPPLDRELMKQLVKVSSLKSIALCVSIYVAVILAGWIGGRLSGYWLAPLAIVVIAGLQNHLLILFHEGSHWLMHPKKKWNDFFTDLFCGAPLLQYVCNYRLLHWTHHRSTGTEGVDPEIELYEGQDFRYVRRSGIATAWMLFKDLFVINLVRFQISFYRYAFRAAKTQGHVVYGPKEALAFFLVWFPVGALAYAFGLWLELLLFWFLPLFTVTFLFLKLHVYGEHNGLDGPTELERTWFHRLPAWVNFLIYPIYSGYHVEHHLFPTVPWYAMPRLRLELKKNPYYVEQCEKVTLDGVFFGQRTILNAMVLGSGRYVDEPEWKAAFDRRSADLAHLAPTSVATKDDIALGE